MKKILLVIFVMIIFLAVAWGGLRADSHVHFNKLGTHLWIPTEYISKQYYFWVDGSNGLDSSKTSIRLRFELFRDIKVFAVLTILDEKARENISSSSQLELEERLGKQGRFSNALIESQPNGLNKVFLTSSIKSKWSVVKREPEPKWLGECGVQEMTGETVCVSSWLYNQFLIEITAEDSYIEVFDDVKDEINSKIDQWKIRPN